MTGPPHYSTDIAAAWTVVERVIALGYHFATDYDAELSKHDYEWTATVGNYKGVHAHEYGDTAPEAICRAALKALA